VSARASLKRFSFLAGILIVLLVLGEVSLRGIWGFGTPLLSEADPQVGYYFKAGQKIVRYGNRISINEYHQRGMAISSDAARRRILLIGDSVAFGGLLTDQENTISAKLEHSLNESGASKWQVLNASAGSWGIGNELAYLKKFGTFKCEIVVFQIGSHDLIQPKSTSERVGTDPSYPKENPTSALSEVMSRYAIPRVRKVFRRKVETGSIRLPEPFTSLTEIDGYFRTNMVYFKEAVLVARAAGARVVVIHTPDRDEALESPRSFGKIYAPFREEFLMLCRELDIPVLDFHGVWKGHPKAAAWFRDVVHLNDEGNAVIAAAVYEFLSNQ
jgi:lysophospholipase L1-like esterase